MSTTPTTVSIHRGRYPCCDAYARLTNPKAGAVYERRCRPCRTRWRVTLRPPSPSVRAKIRGHRVLFAQWEKLDSTPRRTA